MSKKLSRAKAKEILSDGTVHGKALTKKQRGFFGAVAGGQSIKTMQHGTTHQRRARAHMRARGEA